jgi:hypothetical protein
MRFNNSLKKKSNEEQAFIDAISGCDFATFLCVCVSRSACPLP